MRDNVETRCKWMKVNWEQCKIVRFVHALQDYLNMKGCKIVPKERNFDIKKWTEMMII